MTLLPTATEISKDFNEFMLIIYLFNHVYESRKPRRCAPTHRFSISIRFHATFLLTCLSREAYHRDGLAITLSIIASPLYAKGR